MPTSPRSPTAAPKPPAAPGSPPKLARTSCPPSLHGTVHFPSKHSSGETTASINTSLKATNSLNPMTMTFPRASSPRSPPKNSSTFATSAPSGGLFSKLLEKGDDEDEACKWCSRVESSALNQRPDPRPDLEEWRHGSYKPEDTLHTMHILNCDPSSPKKQQSGNGKEC